MKREPANVAISDLQKDASSVLETLRRAEGPLVITEEGSFVLEIDETTLPLGASLTTDNVEEADFVGFGNLDAGILHRTDVYPEVADYNLPYHWGTTGYAWNVDLVRERLPDHPREGTGGAQQPDDARCGFEHVHLLLQLGHQFTDHFFADVHHDGETVDPWNGRLGSGQAFHIDVTPGEDRNHPRQHAGLVFGEYGDGIFVIHFF